MTEPLPPDDRELEQYLQGGSRLSRRYREGSRETAPPELDAAVLAHSRAELRRKRGPNPWLASVALAASVVLAVNLAWNLRDVERVVPAGPAPAEKAPEPPTAPAPQRTLGDGLAREQPEERALARRKQADARLETEARQSAEAAKVEQRARAAAQEQERQQEANLAAATEGAAEPMRREALAGASADQAPPQPPAAPAPALTEAQKIDRLVAYVGGLQDAVFIRNGDEHPAAEAAKHLQMKREKAGKRVQTAGDFIRLCASHSYVTKDAYLIRFPDGRTRTAEDVLREELARIEGGAPP
jgi:hypothetical protein